MAVVLAKDAGIIGLPTGVKANATRGEFRPGLFIAAIEGFGYRLAWSRAAHCPCAPVNSQTDQPDPNCALCQGTGWYLFRPVNGTIDPLRVGVLDPLQRKILGTTSTVIRGIMTGLTANMQPWDQAGPRLEGTMNVTVRAENIIGYYDRLVNLDAVSAYSQVLDVPEGDTLPLRYLVRDVNVLQTITTAYNLTADYTLVDGVITWTLAGNRPDPGERVVCHYLMHPTWRLIEHPHNVRMLVKTRKNIPLETPLGNPIPLPLQAQAKYEWLI